MEVGVNTEKALTDIVERDLEVVGFICANKDGKFSVLAYNEKGLLYSISELVSQLEIYKGNSNGSISSICQIGKRPEPPPPTQEEIEEVVDKSIWNGWGLFR